MSARSLSISLVTTLALTAFALSGSSTVGASGHCPTQINDTTAKLLDCVTLDGVRAHQQALQDIADANGGTRGTGTPGYTASRDYVVQTLEDAGYTVTVQSFPAHVFETLGPSTLEQTAPGTITYTEGPDYQIMSDTEPGDVTAAVTAVDLDLGLGNFSTSGCQAADFVGFPAGDIALIQRGSCFFFEKAQNAANAGAVGVIIFNQGNTTSRLDAIFGSLTSDYTGGIPVVSTTYALGETLAATAGLQMHMVLDVFRGDFTSYNVITETPGGNPDRATVAGAQLNSPGAGPGINGNGSGSAALLETAVQMAGVNVLNKVRFAWWGASLTVDSGSGFYVDSLSTSELAQIERYLDFNTIGSPNNGFFIFDGDDSDGLAFSPIAPGSAEIEQLFESFYGGRSIPIRSISFLFDNRFFNDAGVANGAIFSGSSGIKTADEVALWGGTAGDQHDPCSGLACDTFDNVNLTALDTNADAVAFAILHYALPFPSLAEGVTDGVISAELEHWDIDDGSEHAAGATDGLLAEFHDPDDATGSPHRACLSVWTLDDQGARIGLAVNSSDTGLVDWTITTSHGDATVHNMLEIPGPNDEPCVQWSSARTGSQTITATFLLTGEAVYADGPSGAQPLIKEWNTIDRTAIVPVSGIVSDGPEGGLGDLNNWVAKAGGDSDDTCVRDEATTTLPACHGKDDLHGKTLTVTGPLITLGPAQGNVFAPVQTFLEYAFGSHLNGPGDPPDFAGPIDGVLTKFQVGGTCGAIAIEDPTANPLGVVRASPGDSETVIGSDKGIGFTVFPTSSGDLPANAGEQNLDCAPGETTVIEITTREVTALRSDVDAAPPEIITIIWDVPPPTNKQPILAWAGQRVVLEHDWAFRGADPESSSDDICLGTLATNGDDDFRVAYFKQAQGPGAFGFISTTNDVDQLSNALIVTVDVSPETDEPNSDCISRVVYESQDPGEVDISAWIAEEGTDLFSSGLRSQEVDFLIYYMKLESVTLGIVEGARAGHNSGDFTRGGGNNPFDASKDVTSTTSNISADVLVRARVKGWFANSNLTGRPAPEPDANNVVRPAGRWVMPDDWDNLAGGELALKLRPNYDIAWDPMTTDKTCSTLATPTVASVPSSTVCDGQNQVVGPFSLLDGPANNDGLAPYVVGTQPAYRDSNLPDGIIHPTDAPMPPAKLTFERGGAGFLKEVAKRSIYDNAPFYQTHIPAEPWIPRFTSDAQGYLWDSWHRDGVYHFWTDWLDGSDASKVMVYTDNYGEAMIYVNGDDSAVVGAGSLTFDDCTGPDDSDGSLAENIIVSLSGVYCQKDDVVGATTITATADYPDKRKHSPPVRSNEVDVTWIWAGYKVVTVEEGENDQFNYVVIHELDRDGFCGDSPSLHPVLGRTVDFTLDVIGGGRIVEVSDRHDGGPGTIGLLGQDATTTLMDADDNPDAIAPMQADECQAWVKISNSLLGVTDVLVAPDNWEGDPIFDRIVDFSTEVELDLHFRWTLITWPGEDGIAVAAALSTKLAGVNPEAAPLPVVTAIYGWNAAAQVWLAYFPSGLDVPGANDLAVLNNGQAYWVAITGPNNALWRVP